MSGKTGSVITPQEKSTKAKSFLHAIAEIEQISASEIETDLPPGAFPTPSKLSFTDVAVKHAAITTAATFLMAPFSMLVVDKLLPVFGNLNPGILDTLFAYLLSAAPAVAFVLFFVYIINNLYIRGSVTKSLLNYYIHSYIITKFVTTILFLMFFAIIYNTVFSQTNIEYVAKCISGAMDIVWKAKTSSAYEWSYKWLTYFKSVLMPSAIYSTAVHICCVLLLGAAYLRSYLISKKIDLLRKEWE